MQVSSASSTQAAELAKQMRERMFARADQDGSGGLSLSEFQAAGPGKARSASANAAGGTAASDRAAKIFAKLDTDGDGSVTSAELGAGRADRSGGALSTGSMSAVLSGQEASGNNKAQELFSGLDTDGDGQLSATEFAAGASGGSGKAGHARGHHHGPPPEGAQPDSSSGSSNTSSGTNATSSAATALTELMKKALSQYLQSTTAQSGATTLASA